MRQCIFTIFALLPSFVWAQDYNLYETIYLTPLPGHGNELERAIGQHNREFHSEAPHTAFVDFIVNGPQAGDVMWIMGPSTFSDHDSRPSGDPHDSDWAGNVLAHARTGKTEFWRQNEELSYVPESSAGENRPLGRVRFFEVADNALFQKTQAQVVAVNEARGISQPRLMFQKQFQHTDGRDWVTVTDYASWAELDEEQPGNFQESFEELYGEGALETFQEEFDQSIISRRDEWHQRVPELSGAPADES
jgi:hypothetical protein